MSSPSATGATKRPLEDSSSPNVRDEHDSKRPALEKGPQDDKERSVSPTPVKPSDVAKEQNAAAAAAAAATASAAAAATSASASSAGAAASSTETPSADAKDGDTLVPDAPRQDQHNQSSQPQADESQWIHIRALITSAEAATVIGKGGENVTQIRKMAEAKCTVSDYQRGAGERILTVSGAVDAVAKVVQKPSLSLSSSFHPLSISLFRVG